GPARREPDRNPRLLQRPRLEFARPVVNQLVQTVVEEACAGAWIRLLAELRELARVVASQAGAEHEAAVAQAVEPPGLARQLVRAPPRRRRDHRPDHDPLRRV